MIGMKKIEIVKVETALSLFPIKNLAYCNYFYIHEIKKQYTNSSLQFDIVNCFHEKPKLPFP